MSISREFHNGIVRGGGGGGGLNNYLKKSVDVRYCLYFFVCADLVLDVPLIKYSSAGMSTPDKDMWYFILG